MTTTKTKYLEERIRDGYTSDHVRMWQALCELAKCEVGPSVQHLWTIIDIAKNTHCDVLDVVKMGAEVSEQKNINEKFMTALFMAVASEGEEDDDNDGQVREYVDWLTTKTQQKVLDLTCDEELSNSGSYEEECDRPDSATCYLIDDEAGVASTSTKKGAKRKLYDSSEPF